MYDGAARVELSGATTANWVAKTANLLVDALGQPDRVGLMLPLHWQTVTVLLAAVATDADVLLADRTAGLAGCEVAFVLAADAGAALDLGVAEVLALSGHPMGVAAGALPGLAQDYAREVPSYADHYGGPRPGPARVQVDGRNVEPMPDLTGTDRVLSSLSPSDPLGAAVLLGALRAGAGLILLRDGDPDAVARAEGATATAGCTVAGIPRRG